jgi:hypothetical protein
VILLQLAYVQSSRYHYVPCKVERRPKRIGRRSFSGEVQVENASCYLSPSEENDCSKCVTGGHPPLEQGEEQKLTVREMRYG